jgi:DNA-binding IscR family transcriptional regulator
VSGRTRERLALLAMVAVGRRHYDGEAPWTLDGLTAWLAVPTEVTGDILGALQDRDLLLTTGDDPAGYVPARDLERIPVTEVLEAVRDAGDAAPYPVPADPAVDGLTERLEGTLREALGHATLRDLVRSHPAEPAPAPGDAAPAGAPPRPA